MSAPEAVKAAPEADKANGDLVKIPDDAPLLDMKAPAEVKKEPEANKLFRMVMKLQASDLHLKVGQPPMVRLRGDIRRTEATPVTQEDMERMADLEDRKSTRLNSSHANTLYAVFRLKKKKNNHLV